MTCIKSVHISVMSNKSTTFHLYDIIVFKACLHVSSHSILTKHSVWQGKCYFAHIIDEETSFERLKNNQKVWPSYHFVKMSFYLPDTFGEKKVIYEMNRESYITLPHIQSLLVAYFYTFSFLKAIPVVMNMSSWQECKLLKLAEFSLAICIKHLKNMCIHDLETVLLGI